jgi:transposase
MTTIGIDVSKRKLDVSILLESSKISYKVFENNFQGFKNFHSWLLRLGISQAHVCLEATGCYGEELSLFLYEHGYRVSVVNPARIKAYARSEGCRV